jgi:hypothetical protein
MTPKYVVTELFGNANVCRWVIDIKTRQGDVKFPVFVYGLQRVKFPIGPLVLQPCFTLYDLRFSRR